MTAAPLGPERMEMVTTIIPLVGIHHSARVETQAPANVILLLEDLIRTTAARYSVIVTQTILPLGLAAAAVRLGPVDFLGLHHPPGLSTWDVRDLHRTSRSVHVPPDRLLQRKTQTNMTDRGDIVFPIGRKSHRA